MGIKVEFRLQGLFDIFCLPESVPFLRKGNMSYHQALFVQGFDHGLGLIGWYHFIFQPLKENHWAIELVYRVNGGPIQIDLSVLRIRSDQIV